MEHRTQENDEFRMQNDEFKTKTSSLSIHHSSFIIHRFLSFIVHRSDFCIVLRVPQKLKRRGDTEFLA